MGKFHKKGNLCTDENSRLCIHHQVMYGRKFSTVYTSSKQGGEQKTKVHHKNLFYFK